MSAVFSVAGLQRGWLLAIGIAAYALALLAMAPATLVDAHLQRASDGRLRLAEARGTLWSGSGRVEIRESAGSAGVARDVTWRVTPESLVRGRLVYAVGLGQSAGRFPVALSFSRFQVANMDLRLPARVLGLGVPKLAPLGLTGELLIHVGHLAVAGRATEGNATLRWSAAGSVLTPLSPLGEYEVRLDSSGMKVHASLRTLSGPLQLDGKGSWQHGENPTFVATARVPPQHRQQLAPLLRLIAVETGKGTFELQLK